MSREDSSTMKPENGDKFSFQARMALTFHSTT
jgi:hypothetical protein